MAGTAAGIPKGASMVPMGAGSVWSQIPRIRELPSGSRNSGLR
ncbi:Uncharacterised protein [Hungatella hathewayi]|uniref:Uncharacterized protein n=1 Tax=Hungatella hathewayi TaxID=154046 RepID=A0A174DBM5_9FIRM|nr:Uncharacterised protein [Hungatella hathewayi]